MSLAPESASEEHCFVRESDHQRLPVYFDIDGAGMMDGKERPVVFLLHGGPGGSSDTFHNASFAFADIAQLVYIDYRGCGRSAKADPATYTLDQNIDDLEAIRNYLGLNQVILLGYSYGGMVAQGYTLRYPAAVAKLILLATTPSHRFLAAARRELDKRGNDAQKAICQRLFDGTFENEEQLKHYFRLMGPMYSQTFDLAEFEAKWKPGSCCLDALNRGFSGFLRTFD